MKVPADIQRLKDLVEQNKIVKASLGLYSNEFVYETKCSHCGKAQLAYTRFVSSYYFKLSCFEPLSVRNRQAQELLKKYGIDIVLDQSVLSDFARRRGTCLCALDEPPHCAFGSDTFVDGLSFSAKGEMSFVFEVAGTAYEGRTERIERHSPGDAIFYHRDPQNKYDKNCIEIVDEKGENLGNMPAKFSEHIAPLLDGKIIEARGSIAKIEPRVQRGAKARGAAMHCLITICPTDKNNPVKWLLDNRMECLKREKAFGRSKIRYASGEESYLSDFTHEHYTVGTILECGDAGDPMYAVEAMKEGDPVLIQAAGSLAEGNYYLAVTDQFNNRLGRLPNEFVSAIAPLMEYGGLKIEDPIYAGKTYDPVLDKDFPVIRFSMVAPAFYARSQEESSEINNRIADITSGIVGNPSEKLKKLIVYIKSHEIDLNYFLALGDDGSLCVMDPSFPPGGSYCIKEDFGFDCSDSYGSFHIFTQLSDDDPIDILAQNGIMVGDLGALGDAFDDAYYEEHGYEVNIYDDEDDADF